MVIHDGVPTFYNQKNFGTWKYATTTIIIKHGSSSDILIKLINNIIVFSNTWTSHTAITELGPPYPLKIVYQCLKTATYWRRSTDILTVEIKLKPTAIVPQQHNYWKHSVRNDVFFLKKFPKYSKVPKRQGVQTKMLYMETSLNGDYY